MVERKERSVPCTAHSNARRHLQVSSGASCTYNSSLQSPKTCSSLQAMRKTHTHAMVHSNSTTRHIICTVHCSCCCLFAQLTQSMHACQQWHHAKDTAGKSGHMCVQSSMMCSAAAAHPSPGLKHTSTTPTSLALTAIGHTTARSTAGSSNAQRPCVTFASIKQLDMPAAVHDGFAQSHDVSTNCTAAAMHNPSLRHMQNLSVSFVPARHVLAYSRPHHTKGCAAVHNGVDQAHNTSTSCTAATTHKPSP
jgi:hypothetical protein